MEVRVLVLPGGKLQIFVDGQVTFDQAQAITQAVLAQLAVQGVAISEVGPVEQHREGVTHAHVQEHIHHGH